MDFRTERDSLGEVQVPAGVFYGAQTARAVENFPVSGLRAHPQLIRATAMIKLAAARVNRQLGLLPEDKAAAIAQAAQEVVDGLHHRDFVVDVYQAGAGTSHNMNTNEVIANRAIEMLDGQRGDYSIVHPNDHVNMAQSTNDVMPTAIRLASLMVLPGVTSALEDLASALDAKAAEFQDVVKSGRTHLQDAVPVTLGMEFGAYAAAVRRSRQRILRAAIDLPELNIGGTAAGTGLNAHRDYHRLMVAELSSLMRFQLKQAENLAERMQSMGDFAALSGSLRDCALELTRIANDVRLLSSGPRTGLQEVRLPAVQPGSSIMPGKVNPVMAEMLNMVCYQVVGNDLTVAMAVQAGQLELNVMMPVIGHNLLFSMDILANAVRLFTDRCVRGIAANDEHARYLAEWSLGMATVLNTAIGYSAAAELAKEAYATGRTLRDLATERQLLPPDQLEAVFDLLRAARPHDSQQ